MEAQSSRTARYSSASLASSSRAWTSCALMLAPLGGEGGGALGPAPWCGPVPGPGEPLRRRFRRARGVRLVVGEHDEALPRGVVALGARVVGVAEPVVRGIEEPLDHHWLRHAGEVPLRVPVRSGGWQLAGGAVVRLDGGGEVPSRRDAAAGMALARCHISASRRGVRHRGAAQAEGEPRSRNRTPPPPAGAVAVSSGIALRGDARDMSSFRPCLSRALTRAPTASRCSRTRSVRLSGRRGVSSGCDGGRSRPSRPPRAKLVAVGDAHEVAVPRGLKVQAPESDFEPGWEGVRAAHGIPLAPVLGANHHRDGWWELIFSADPPTWRTNCRCGK
jgi:hypothetical protein